MSSQYVLYVTSETGVSHVLWQVRCLCEKIFCTTKPNGKCRNRSIFCKDCRILRFSSFKNEKGTP